MNETSPLESVNEVHLTKFGFVQDTCLHVSNPTSVINRVPGTHVMIHFAPRSPTALALLTGSPFGTKRRNLGNTSHSLA